jgi:hypothetical protein
MRSGPLGVQLAVIAASPGASDRLEFAALGPPIGTAALSLRERRGVAVLTDDGQLTFVVPRR